MFVDEKNVNDHLHIIKNYLKPDTSTEKSPNPNDQIDKAIHELEKLQAELDASPDWEANDRITELCKMNNAYIDSNNGRVIYINQSERTLAYIYQIKGRIIKLTAEVMKPEKPSS